MSPCSRPCCRLGANLVLEYTQGALVILSSIWLSETYHWNEDMDGQLTLHNYGNVIIYPWHNIRQAILVKEAQINDATTDENKQ